MNVDPQRLLRDTARLNVFPMQELMGLQRLLGGLADLAA
jgi:hypothetical protein